MSDFADVEEFFAPFANVSIRRMFSGQGIYIDDACFALALRGTYWLKADGATKGTLCRGRLLSLLLPNEGAVRHGRVLLDLAG